MEKRYIEKYMHLHQLRRFFKSSRFQGSENNFRNVTNLVVAKYPPQYPCIPDTQKKKKRVLQKYSPVMSRWKNLQMPSTDLQGSLTDVSPPSTTSLREFNPSEIHIFNNVIYWIVCLSKRCHCSNHLNETSRKEPSGRSLSEMRSEQENTTGLFNI